MVNDKRYIYYYNASDTGLQQDDGSIFPSQGWGGIIVILNSKQYGIAPVYFCPENPKNYISPGTMLIFCAFAKTIVDTNGAFYLRNIFGSKFKYEFTVHNYLDYLQFDIGMFESQTFHHLSTCPSQHLQSLARI